MGPVEAVAPRLGEQLRPDSPGDVWRSRWPDRVERADDDRVAGLDREHGRVVAGEAVVGRLGRGLEHVAGHDADPAAPTGVAPRPAAAAAADGTTTGGVDRSSSTTSRGAVRLR